MIEESSDETRYVERNELMHHPARQALLGETARGHGSGGNQNRDVARANALDQRQNTGELAYARAVQPDQWPLWPRNAAFATAFGQALAIFLSALDPARKQYWREWCRRA